MREPVRIRAVLIICSPSLSRLYMTPDPDRCLLPWCLWTCPIQADTFSPLGTQLLLLCLLGILFDSLKMSSLEHWFLGCGTLYNFAGISDVIQLYIKPKEFTFTSEVLSFFLVAGCVVI